VTELLLAQSILPCSSRRDQHGSQPGAPAIKGDPVLRPEGEALGTGGL